MTTGHSSTSHRTALGKFARPRSSVGCLCPPGVNPEIGLTPEGMSVGSAGARDASRQPVALLARLGLSLGHERRGPGAGDDPAVLPAPIVVGVLAAVVQFLGLARWPFLVPALARTYTDLASTAATRGGDEGRLRLFPPLPRSRNRRALAISSPEPGAC